MPERSAQRPRVTARRIATAVAAIACLFAAAPVAAQAELFRVEGSFGADQIQNPTAIATDDAGRVFVADAGAHRVAIFDSASGGNAYLGSFGENQSLPEPSGIAVDNRARIYLVDAVRAQVIRFTSYADGTEVSRVLGDPGTELGQFADPRQIALSARADVYVADRQNVRVQWIASTGLPRAGFGVGDLNPPGFNSPHGVARQASTGSLYVSSDERGAGGVRLYDQRGLFLRSVAGPGSGPADVSGPTGLALDRADRLLVADTGHSRVSAYASGVDGNGFLGSIGGLGAPVALAFAPGATLYVADAGSGQIVRLRYDDADSDGVIDARDNCRELANGAQRDADHDGVGDACDPDADGDGLAKEQDPCPQSPRGADSNGDGCTDPSSRITAPALSSYRRGRPPTRIAGTAQADRLGVARVEVAVGRRGSGARCSWYRRGGSFGAARSCARPAYLPAHGTRSWAARVHNAQRGTYVIASRAVQRGGLVERLRARANRRSVRLR